MREIADLHQPFIAWLRKRNLLYVYHRPDRKSGINKGHPDFSVLLPDGKVKCVEFKTPTSSLSSDQTERIQELTEHGTPVLVAFTLETAIAWIEGVKVTEPELPAESKFYIANSNLGQVVVAKDQAGTWGAIRVASEEDVRNFPKRTEAVK